jgi:hypothetical protein
MSRPNGKWSEEAAPFMITADVVSRIVGFKGDGLPVVSMYTQVPIDARIRT